MDGIKYNIIICTLYLILYDITYKLHTIEKLYVVCTLQTMMALGVWLHLHNQIL